MRETERTKMGLDLSATAPKFHRCPECRYPTLEIIEVEDVANPSECTTHCLHCGRLKRRLLSDFPVG